MVLSNPPFSADPVECGVRSGSSALCVSAVTEDYEAKTAAEAGAAQSFAEAIAIDTRDWSCSDGLCPVFVDHRILKTDPTHLKAAVATAVGRLLQGALATD